MKYKKAKKYTSPVIPLFMALLLASCAPNNQAGNEPPSTEETAALPDTQESGKTEVPDTSQEAIDQDQSNLPETSSEESPSLDSQKLPAEETTSAAVETTAPVAVSLANPMRPVDSEKDFTALGLPLSLPENESRCSKRAYFIIDGKVAQISFYDEVTKSNALARAGNETDGDPSGIYYNFDTEKEETWSASMADGTQVDITVSVTVDNSDIHGVLAAWTYKGVRYSLWEDSARDQTSEVGKLAVEIAKRALKKETAPD